MAVHADLSVELQNHIFIDLFQRLFNSAKLPSNCSSHYVELVLFLIALMNKSERSQLARKVSTSYETASHITEASPVNKYLQDADILLNKSISLRESCVLRIRQLILKRRNFEVKSTNCSYHHGNINYWISKRQEDSTISIEGLGNKDAKEFSIPCPLYDLISDYIPLPRSLCEEISGRKYLTSFVSRIWQECVE